MLLAQYSPSFTGTQLATFLAILFFIAALVIAIRQAFGNNPPLHKEYATKNELREIHGRIKREREEINAAIKAQADDARGLRDKLDEQTHELNKRIDAVPERTIELMRSAQELNAALRK